ncbi:hypothetical protein PROPHIGD20-1_119 [Mycobacterium phage prophiGD20-1]|nr:hypothetical protein PROPHIGD20-1_119 [Mycobacterium phage prophiGD20-1]
MAVSFDEQAGDRGPQAVFSANCLNRRHESSWLFQWQPARSRSIVNTVASPIATLWARPRRANPIMKLAQLANFVVVKRICQLVPSEFGGTYR